MQANDLREFADKLDLTAFKALSSGIGIGAVRDRVPAAKLLPAPAPKQLFAPAAAAETQAKAQPPRPAKAKLPKASPPGRPTLAFEKKLVAWALDFFFVALTLGVLVALLTVVTAVRTGETENVFALAPIQWLMGIHPLELVAGVYGLFFAYLLLFKTVAGVTLGESLLRARLARAP